MGGPAQLNAWFDSGALCRPDPTRPDTVDVIRALAHLCGSDAVSPTDAALDIASTIGEHEHYIFVLVDGMGAEMLAEAPGCDFLKGLSGSTIQSVFPSTTAAALTALATGQWPCTHGAMGWWLYLADRGLSITPLPFIERFGREPLTELGVKPEEVFPVPSIVPSFKKSPATTIGQKFVDSVYTSYICGGTPRIAFESEGDVVDAVLSRLDGAAGPTFTHIYFGQYDSMCHDNGTRHELAVQALQTINGELAKLRELTDDDVRIAVTADHGLVDIPDENRRLLKEDDPLVSLLVAPPSGEARTLYFHVREGKEDGFHQEFMKRYEGLFALLTPDEAEQLRLFGPAPLADVARSRLGTYIAIASCDVALEYRHSSSGPYMPAAHHGGMLKCEMEVPLLIC